MAWSHDEAAERMGMPPHEILAVAEVGDYHVVTTHDGQHTVVTDDGATEPYGGDPAQLEQPESLQLTETGSDPEQQREENGQGDRVEVPDGTIDEVLAWVGDDADRAQHALAAEKGRDKPRSSLVGQLEKLTEPPA